MDHDANGRIGPQTVLLWIPWRELRLGSEYNRPLKLSWVNYLALHFDDDLLTPLVVSRRGDGRYYIIDGQHRYRALEKLGFTDRVVQCAVVSDVSIADEARMFVTIATTRGITPHEKHRARLIANDAEALSVQKAIDLAGFAARHSSSSGSLGAIETAYHIHRLGKYEGLRDVLLVARDAWDAAPNGTTMNGVFRVMRRHGAKLNRERLVRVLSATSPTDIFNKARETVAREGGSPSTRAYEHITRRYDTGLRSGRLVPRPHEEDEVA